MKIYFDHAATTPVDPEVLKAMELYFTKEYGNPSSLYSLGQEAKGAIEKAREKIAGLLNADPEEIIFTSGATESNNLAIKGVVSQYKIQNTKYKIQPHIITSSIEHHSVLDTVKYLEKNFGVEATYLPVDQYGVVSPQDLESLIKDNTVLVSIMHANNEIGTIEPICEIGSIIQNAKIKRQNKGNDLPIVFHTDAVQSFQYLDVDVEKLGVDMLSLTGHKFYGPKGVGVLYVKSGTKFLSQQQGGAQERKRRAGTENVPYIVGMAKAMELAVKSRESESVNMAKLRDSLTAKVLEEIPDVILTGHPKERLPNSASFCVKFIEGESMLINLDQAGIAVSSGSACTSGSLEPSHVLVACGIDLETIHGSLRITLGHENTEKDIDYFVEKLAPIVKNLREISPFK